MASRVKSIFSLPFPQDNSRLLGLEPKKPPKHKRRDNRFKKRGKGSDDESSESSSDESWIQELLAKDDAEKAFDWASLTKDEHEQLRVAGLRPGEPIPGGTFPHKKHDPDSLGSLTDLHKKIRKELEEYKLTSDVDPALYMPLKEKNRQMGAAAWEQHIAVLSAILHMSMSRGDLFRSRQAFALLLRSGWMTVDIRSKQGIHGMDLRAQDQWTIGGELLARNENPPSEKSPRFSDEGIQRAREYYGRLAVQYPYRKKGTYTDARTFYTAMFSLWIFYVHDKYQRLRKPSEDDEEQGDEEPDSWDEVPSINDEGASNDEPSTSDKEASDSDSELEAETSNIDKMDIDDPFAADELDEVRDIASKLDEVILGPPFDQNAQLLEMRGDIELWLISLKRAMYDEDSNVEDLEQDPRRRAAYFFRRAQKAGGKLRRRLAKLVEIFDEFEGDEEDDAGGLVADFRAMDMDRKGNAAAYGSVAYGARAYGEGHGDHDSQWGTGTDTASNRSRSRSQSVASSTKPQGLYSTLPEGEEPEEAFYSSEFDDTPFSELEEESDEEDDHVTDGQQSDADNKMKTIKDDSSDHHRDSSSEHDKINPPKVPMRTFSTLDESQDESDPERNVMENETEDDIELDISASATPRTFSTMEDASEEDDNGGSEDDASISGAEPIYGLQRPTRLFSTMAESSEDEDMKSDSSKESSHRPTRTFSTMQARVEDASTESSEEEY